MSSISSQIAGAVLTVRPASFRMNEQTAVNNYFQSTDEKISPENVNSFAQREFDGFVEQLRGAGVEVVVVQDLKEADTPDSVFPNNWVSFHAAGDIDRGVGRAIDQSGSVSEGDVEGGAVILYPMFAPNRRRERRMDIVDTLRSMYKFKVCNIVDYSQYESQEQFLEGTGSLILDRVHRKAYCALSPRAREGLLRQYCEEIGYRPVVFEAFQTIEGVGRKHIYHTNVMLCIGETFAVVCLDCIDKEEDRKRVVDSFIEDNKAIIEISEKQVGSFAGNMLELRASSGQRLLVMSKSAFDCLLPEQVQLIQAQGCDILHSDLSTIETFGGGSAQCMMAEIFLPKSA